MDDKYKQAIELVDKLIQSDPHNHFSIQFKGKINRLLICELFIYKIINQFEKCNHLIGQSFSYKSQPCLFLKHQSQSDSQLNQQWNFYEFTKDYCYRQDYQNE
ncbi:unnamed protein product [Paramecium octaurelia]|uniref:Tetratricopeptide repeat protein n=1 Tax=Paramecium octaurelia TaxID=43137 RepID=A0A8S1YNA0_PAROT|nr:unnamed protein product [Paramecium octaurelia]